jgi:hypothetical protein
MVRSKTRRDMLKATTGTVTAVAFGASGNALAQSRGRQDLDFERDDDGDIEFDYEDLSFESDDGKVELRDDDIDFEADDTDMVELRIDRGGVQVDLDVKDQHDLELRMASGSDTIDLEVDDRDEVEFEADGSLERAFEAEDGDVEYRGRSIDVDWDAEDSELDIRGDVSLELDLSDGIDIEYDDGTVDLDYETNGDTSLEYTGQTVEIDWENGRDDDFEAREA